MNDKIKTHVDGLFEGAPQSRKVQELKEELLGNLNSKYDDLISEGFTPDDAYRTVIAGIGDVSELMRQIQNESAFNSNYSPADRKKSAMFVAISVGLYILSPVCVILFGGALGQGVLGVILMFVFVALATGLLIYNSMSSPKYIKEDDTIVEEFKQWKSDSSEKKRIRNSITSILWTLIVIIYLVFSFYLDAWAYSWIIFIIGVLLEGIIKLIFDLKGRNT